MAKAYDYEPCEVCRAKRWKGLPHPLCKECWNLIQAHFPSVCTAWQTTKDKVMGLNVSIPLKAAIIALAKEIRRPDTAARLAQLSQLHQS